MGSGFIPSTEICCPKGGTSELFNLILLRLSFKSTFKHLSRKVITLLLCTCRVDPKTTMSSPMLTTPSRPCNSSLKADSNKSFELEKLLARTLNTYTPSSVSIAVKSLDFSFNRRWKNPLVASNTEKNFVSLSLKLTSSEVFELQTGLAIYLLRLDGSKQMLRSPLGFFNYNRGVEPFSCLITVKLRNDTLFFHTMNFLHNLSFTETGTCLAGFCTGTASSDNWMFTISTGNLPTLKKIDLNLAHVQGFLCWGWYQFFSWQLSNANDVWSLSQDLDTLQLKLTRFNWIKSGRPRIGLHLFGTTKNRQVYGKLQWEW